MSTVSAHPVRVEGRLDPELSRWLDINGDSQQETTRDHDHLELQPAG